MSESKSSGETPKPTHHFGRGGAGNLTSKDDKSPGLPPTATPTLKNEHYTTGRGGTGNMAKNDFSRPEEARAAQDVDVPGILLSEGPRSTGRGGAANVYRPSDEEIKDAKENNDRVRHESFGRRDRTGLKALADKGRELLRGGRKQSSGPPDKDESAIE